MTYTYTRKAQVLRTEDAYRTHKKVSTKTSKKLRTLIREAVERYMLRKNVKRRPLKS